MLILQFQISLVYAIMEFYYIIKAGHASRTTNVVEQITGRKPVSFEQFVRNYASSFTRIQISLVQVINDNVIVIACKS
jgi:hypothetical protein